MLLQNRDASLEGQSVVVFNENQIVVRTRDSVSPMVLHQEHAGLESVPYSGVRVPVCYRGTSLIRRWGSEKPAVA
jgi:hypothetical protein